MTILNAALKDNLFESAREYLSSGVSILPLRGKVSALKSWAMAQQYRASQKVLTQWRDAGLLSGIGVVCGAISGNLVVLDFDSHEAVCEFEDTFPALTDTYCVSSGSRRGAHYYFYSKELPSSVLVRNYELRANGMYVVAPPSLHPVSGLRYEVRRCVEPKHLDNMRQVVAWVKSHRPAPAPAPQMPQVAAPQTRGNLSREAYFRERYIAAAVNRQLHFLSTATEGTRNSQLYVSAVALGQLVGSGAVARAVIETELLNLALRSGLSEAESRATIRSGINTGEQRPRKIPPPPAHRK